MNVVLVEPRIPQNTGNIARLTAGTGSRLHLIEPLGFELSDKYLKRAGLDYWEFVDFSVHASWEDFCKTEAVVADDLWIYSTHATTEYSEVEYKKDSYLVFGNEVGGLDQKFHDSYVNRRVKIPMKNPSVRSFNLANSVAIGLFEAQRQIGLKL